MKLKILDANALICSTWIGQKLLCIMKKIMSQIKPSLVPEFRYEIKVGISLIVGEATTRAPLLDFSGGHYH